MKCSYCQAEPQTPCVEITGLQVVNGNLEVVGRGDPRERMHAQRYMAAERWDRQHGIRIEHSLTLQQEMPLADNDSD